MNKMLIIDGNSILNRAFYGIRPLTAKDGTPTNALYGFVNILSHHINTLSPSYVAVAFDVHHPTFRHEYYSEYKAGRHETPEDLLTQMPISKEVASAMGICVLEKPGYEADDILGTLASMGEKNGIEVYVLTGDRDSLQLISDTTKVLLAGNKETALFDRDRFFEKYSIQPEQFVDLKALMGDSSDNIPGVAGVGEKTAIKLISSEKSLDELYNGIENKDIAAGLKQKLIQNKENAYMSQYLARIIKDVPLEISLENLEYKGANEKLAPLFTRLEFFSFIDRFSVEKRSEKAETVVFEKKDSLPFLDKNDTYAVAFRDGNAFVCSDKISFCTDKELVKGFLADKEYKKAVYDLKNIYKDHGELNGIVNDVMLSAYLDDPSPSSFDLYRIASSYLGENITEESGSADALLILRLEKVLSEKIKQNGMEKLLREIELPLAYVLADMEEKGFKIDRTGLEEYGITLQKISDELKERIYMLAGIEFNINSPKQLGEVLFERLGLPSGKKTKTGYSTNADVLEKLRAFAPIVDDILEYRQVNKLKSTYVDGLLKVADNDGRVHTSFNQTGTATGRLSSSEPNLQNIPIKTDIGRELRRFFVPLSDEYVLVDADYSQIELRILACISGDETMQKAFLDGTDIHTLTASQVFRVPVESVTKEMRKRAKAVNFGIVYGISDFSLAADIKVSKKEAGEYIKSYFEKYPAVAEYLSSTVEFASRNGYVTTLFGRRRYIPEIKSSKATLRKFGERVAMNSPIQGTSADIIKLAMVNTQRSLIQSGIDAHIILQVHDELIIQANKKDAEKAKEILKNEMESALKSAVPFEVEISVGTTWYECK